MFSQTQILKLDKFVKDACTRLGYELHGSLAAAKNNDGKWTLVIKSKAKTVFVKLVVPYSFADSNSEITEYMTEPLSDIFLKTLKKKENLQLLVNEPDDMILKYVSKTDILN